MKAAQDVKAGIWSSWGRRIRWALGLVDALQEKGIKVFGPSRAGRS